MIAETIELLGRKAKDKVTGFEGVVSSVSFDLYGCIQAALTPGVDKDGKTLDGHWFDTNRLAMKSGARVMPLPDFDKPADEPADHAHGLAEKPAGRHV